MFGLDDMIANLSDGTTFGIVMAVAVLLGLRHATDPDHLAAVTAVAAGSRDQGGRQSARLGLAWGSGHALTLFVFGLPIVLFAAYLPGTMQQGAETLVGLVIIALAVWLLARWRRGYFDPASETACRCENAAAGVRRRAAARHRRQRRRRRNPAGDDRQPRARRGRPRRARGLHRVVDDGADDGLRRHACAAARAAIAHPHDPGARRGQPRVRCLVRSRRSGAGAVLLLSRWRMATFTIS